MVDDFLEDDDVIIDLTELLDEGTPPQEAKEKPVVGMPEPESFDLGKELAMDEDVSVEEIDAMDSEVDLNVDLSTVETAALGEGGEDFGALARDLDQALDQDAGIAAPPEEGRVEEALDVFKAEDVEAPVREVELEVEPPAGTQPNGEDVFSFADKDQAAPSISEEAAISQSLLGELAEAPEQRLEEIPGIEPAAAPPVAGIVLPEEEPVVAPEEPVIEAPVMEELPEIPVAVQPEAGMAEAGSEVLEAAVRPLVRELISAVLEETRRQLPEVVERVVREEIEKLNKIS